MGLGMIMYEFGVVLTRLIGLPGGGRFICWSVRVRRPRWGAGGDYCPFTLTLPLSQKKRGPWIPRLIVASLQRRERELGRTSPL